MDARRGSVNAQDAVPERAIARPGRWRIAPARVPRGVEWERLARPTLLPGLLLALWQYASAAGLFDPSFVPSPTDVAGAWWQWIFGPRSELAWYSGTWLEYVYLSAWRVLIGFAIASAVGISVGVLIGWFALMN